MSQAVLARIANSGFDPITITNVDGKDKLKRGASKFRKFNEDTQKYTRTLLTIAGQLAKAKVQHKSSIDKDGHKIEPVISFTVDGETQHISSGHFKAYAKALNERLADNMDWYLGALNASKFARAKRDNRLRYILEDVEDSKGNIQQHLTFDKRDNSAATTARQFSADFVEVLKEGLAGRGLDGTAFFDERRAPATTAMKFLRAYLLANNGVISEGSGKETKFFYTLTQSDEGRRILQLLRDTKYEDGVSLLQSIKNPDATKKVRAVAFNESRMPHYDLSTIVYKFVENADKDELREYTTQVVTSGNDFGAAAINGVVDELKAEWGMP